MTTEAAIREAELLNKRRRYANHRLLQIDQARATPDETKLFAMVQAVDSAERFDNALAHLAVNAAFLRGVFSFRNPAT